MRFPGVSALVLVALLLVPGGEAALARSLAASVVPAATAATVRWQAPAGSRVVVEYGRDRTYGLWARSTTAVAGETTLSGLEPATTYAYRISAVDGDSHLATTGSFVTRALGNVRAETRGGVLLVDSQPAFPRMVFRQCTWGVADNLQAGINLFMGACDRREGALVSAVAGRAFVVPDISSRKDGPGVVGWHLRDEADLWVMPQALPLLPAAVRETRVAFLTLSSHFWDAAAPGPLTRALYPAMVAKAGMVGFTLYPLTSWCRRAFGAVHAAQQAMTSLAAGKPTFQWIEAAPMGDSPCFRNGRLTPTASTVRIETWLAIIGGAKGIGYFPADWPPEIKAEIAAANQKIATLAPALLSPAIPATSKTASDPIKVTARTYNGATYAIAVNSTGRGHPGRIAVPSLKAATVQVWGEARSLPVQAGGRIDDWFAPYAVHVYLAVPAA